MHSVLYKASTRVIIFVTDDGHERLVPAFMINKFHKRAYLLQIVLTCALIGIILTYSRQI